LGVIGFNHAASHFPPPGLGFLSKKELATALAGSLGPVAFTRQFTRFWRGVLSPAPRRSRASFDRRVRTHRMRPREVHVSINGSSSPLTHALRVLPVIDAS
jgi:hypothetical protein